MNILSINQRLNVDRDTWELLKEKAQHSFTCQWILERVRCEREIYNQKVRYA